MTLTKSQLKQIIKEELEKALNEDDPPVGLYADKDPDEVEALNVAADEAFAEIERGGPGAMAAFERWKKLRRRLAFLTRPTQGAAPPRGWEGK